MLITSPANERLKHARRVRDGREEGLIFVEGERLIEECLQSGLALATCFHSPEVSPRAEKILAQIAERGCPLFPATDAVLATISDTVNTQGIIVLAKLPTYMLDQVLSSGDLVVCLDAIQDPGNFGTILRTAEAAGANGVVALKDSVDAFAPKTLRSAMGSGFRLPIATNVGSDELLTKSQARGLKVVATMAEGETIYSHFDWYQPSLIVFGNEANGVRQELLQRADVRIRIPLRAPVESLNVSAAAAAILFEAARQRGIG
ncbi:MAG: RNA methyltransferase [Acidobacteria bacterium]|nr:RNA methyltransferase [Acidobacteriota bacterium]